MAIRNYLVTYEKLKSQQEFTLKNLLDELEFDIKFDISRQILIEDIFCEESEYLFRIFGPGNGFEGTTAEIAFDHFLNLPPATITRNSIILNNIFTKALHKQYAGKNELVITKLRILLYKFPESIDFKVHASLVLTPSLVLSTENRVTLAIALSLRDMARYIHWEDINYQNNPELIPGMLNSMRKTDPDLGFFLLSCIRNVPDPVVVKFTIQYLELLLLKLAEKSNNLEEIFARMVPEIWVQDMLEEICSTNESLNRIVSKPTKDYQFEKLIDDFISNKEELNQLLREYA